MNLELKSYSPSKGFLSNWRFFSPINPSFNLKAFQRIFLPNTKILHLCVCSSCHTTNPNIYCSILAQIILFLEMLKFSKNIFLKEKIYIWNIMGFFFEIEYSYLFIYLCGKHVLKRPRSYCCLGVLTNVVRWVFDFVTNPWFWFYWIFKSKESPVMIFRKKIRFKKPLVLVFYWTNSKNRRFSGKSWQRTVSSWAVLSTTKLQNMYTFV